MTHLLQVCVTCRPKGSEADEVSAGRALFEAVAAAGPDGYLVRPIECLSGCSRSCTLAFAAPGKASTLFGDLLPTPATIAAAVEMAALYRASSDGAVAWKERPVPFQAAMIARIPTSHE